MTAVILLDQKGSRRSPDLVNTWLEDLHNDSSLHFLLPPERTAGDETQALTSDAQTLTHVALVALQSSRWWLGVGIGEVETPLPATVRASRGKAFMLARQALELAKKRRAVGLRVLAQYGDATDFESALRLMRVLYERRTPRAQLIADLHVAGLSTVEIGRKLGVSQQASAKQVYGSHVFEELGGRRLVLHLAEALMP
ncbi:MAG: hypothetical protein WBF51_11935 [Candidatus Dormiibacterota bacterium]